MFGYSRIPYWNYILILALIFLFAAFQSTFWFQIFGPVPAPLLWLNVILYLCLYRKPFEALILSYAIIYILRHFTAFPIGYLWLNILISGSILIYIKNRFFWPGPRYYFFASLGFTFLFHFVSLILSFSFEQRPMAVQFFLRLAEIIFTTSTSIPIIIMMTYLDRLTIQDHFKEQMGENSEVESL